MKVLKNAGINGCKFHDLRHLATSYIAMSGIDLNAIMEVLGFESPGMVFCYCLFVRVLPGGRSEHS